MSKNKATLLLFLVSVMWGGGWHRHKTCGKCRPCRGTAEYVPWLFFTHCLC